MIFDFKPKDYVVCIGDKNISEAFGNSSVGWNKDFCYQIDRIEDHKKYGILWPTEGRFGIFHDQVRLATYEEIETYKEYGKPYNVSKHIPKVDLEGIINDLDKCIEAMEKRTVL